MSNSGGLQNLPVSPDALALPTVSVLFVTYKRFALLKRSLQAFRGHTDYPHLQLVIADDGSPAEIQRQIRTLQADEFVLSPRNTGLGANNNRGLQRCTGKYVLMLQDDWICTGPPCYLREAVAVMEANPTLGIINFAGAFHQPDLSQRLRGSGEPCFLTPPPKTATPQLYLYSDQPHLQSRESLDYLGPYLQDRNMERCERDYEVRWAAQTRYTVAVFPKYWQTTFGNEGIPHSFRTTSLRNRTDRALMPLANYLRTYFTPGFKVGKAAVRRVQQACEALLNVFR